MRRPRLLSARVSRTGLAALTAAAVLLVATAQLALAAPGSSSTTHFTSVMSWGTPTAPTTNMSNCPAAVLDDYNFVDATGHGVSHQNTNPAQDFWATSTFTGTGTVTFYPASSLSFDSQGNVTGVTGPSDMTVSGHLTDWFGISANKQNSVFHGTVNFKGMIAAGPGAGSPIRFHNVTHGAWLPGTDPNGPPSFYFNVASCN